jgi:hypothetical protein
MENENKNTALAEIGMETSITILPSNFNLFTSVR